MTNKIYVRRTLVFSFFWCECPSPSCQSSGRSSFDTVCDFCPFMTNLRKDRMIYGIVITLPIDTRYRLLFDVPVVPFRHSVTHAQWTPIQIVPEFPDANNITTGCTCRPMLGARNTITRRLESFSLHVA